MFLLHCFLPCKSICGITLSFHPCLLTPFQPPPSLRTAGKHASSSKFSSDHQVSVFVQHMAFVVKISRVYVWIKKIKTNYLNFSGYVLTLCPLPSLFYRLSQTPVVAKISFLFF